MADARDELPRLKFRQRHPVLTVMLLLLSLLLIGPVLAECWRQWRIHRAEQEIREAHAEVAAQFDTVTNWRAWYRNRMPSDWGGDAFHAWAKALRANVGELDSRAMGSPGAPVATSPMERRGDVPSSVGASQNLIGGVDAFFSFSSLTPLPDTSGPVASSGIGDIVYVARLLRLHVIHADSPEQAWRSLWRLVQLLRRVPAVCHHLEYEIVAELEADAWRCFARLAATETIPPYVQDLLPVVSRTFDVNPAVEYMAAFSAQAGPELGIYPAIADGGPNREAWFGWARNSRRLRKVGDHFYWPIEYGLAEARTCSSLAHALREVRRGGTAPVGIRELWGSGIQEVECLVKLAAARANVVGQLRRAGAASGLPASSGIKVAESPQGWIVAYDASPADQAVLSSSEAWTRDQEPLLILRLPR